MRYFVWYKVVIFYVFNFPMKNPLFNQLCLQDRNLTGN